jgi:imidazolonepropionase-like amidohydrolase
MRLSVTLGTLVIGVGACATTGGKDETASTAAAPVTAIVHATVIPMDTERVVRDATVIIRGDRIVWVGSTADASIPRHAKRVDARGAFLLPGLADMHVHTEERDMPLFLRNGVTTIREMNGSAELLALRDRIARGAIPGPTMHVAGTLLAGEKQRWRHRLIRTPDEGRIAVREQVASGYEFIKVYDGLSVESYTAIVAEARQLHVRVIGHVPVAVGLFGVLAAHQDEIEHIEQIVRPYIYRDTTAWRARIDSAASAIAAAGTWVNPTLAVEEGLSRAGTATYAARLKRPEMRFVDSATFAWWASLRRSSHGDSNVVAAAVDPANDFSSPRARAVVEAKRATVMALRAHGVRLLAGTDLPNPLMVAGFAIHEELGALVTAGLTPFEAIASATRNAGEFMGGDRFGIVAPGARADLLLVARNPLEDVAALREPRGVMVRGRWVDPN